MSIYIGIIGIDIVSIVFFVAIVLQWYIIARVLYVVVFKINKIENGLCFISLFFLLFFFVL